MSRSIPTPLLAAAGLAATVLDEARRLPNRLATLPVTVVGAAMQASMRAQQQYAELVGRGDQLLSQLREPDEKPAWARFDEDEDDILADPVDATDEDDVPEPVDGARPAADLPLPQYDQLSLPQLRARLRQLSATDLERLIEHERATTGRAPFLTMLENRLRTVRH